MVLTDLVGHHTTPGAYAGPYHGSDWPTGKRTDRGAARCRAANDLGLVVMVPVTRLDLRFRIFMGLLRGNAQGSQQKRCCENGG